MFELIFLKILLQISIFLLQTVPKHYTSIQYTVKNSVILIFKPSRSKKLFLLYGQTLRSSKFAMEVFMKFDWHYSVKQWLTLMKNIYISTQSKNAAKNSHLFYSCSILDFDECRFHLVFRLWRVVHIIFYKERS